MSFQSSIINDSFFKLVQIVVNTIYLEKQIGVAPGAGNNFIYGVNNWNFIQYFSLFSTLFIYLIRIFLFFLRSFFP
jgi:hypothetical protein